MRLLVWTDHIRMEELRGGIEMSWKFARALRFEVGLPLQYWGDCVLCAVHITNRSPSNVLNGKTPYEVLFTHPLQSFKSFWVFGYG